MNQLSLTLLLLALGLSAAFALACRTSRAISASLYDDFVLTPDIRPPHITRAVPDRLEKRSLDLSEHFERGRTKGLIARDDDRQEIVVSFRGTFSLSTAITNAQFLLSPFLTPGLNVSESVDILVHRGFRDAYDNVANDVLAIVMVQLALFPEFRVVVTGHSLGGAIASFGAPHFRPLRLRSTHSPRIGNAEFASWVEKTLGEENIYRTVYTFDGVPTMVPRFLNYTHFATEYWQFRDPVPFITTRESTVKQCVRGEDPTCSVRIPSTGINPFHTVYLGWLLVAVIPDLRLCF